MDGTKASYGFTSAAGMAVALCDPEADLVLIPDSGIQFVVRELTSEAAVTIVQRYFLDRGNGRDEPTLHVVELDSDGHFYHPVTGEPTSPASTAAIDGDGAARAFVGEWLPIPLFKIGAEDEPEPTVGPINWARLKLTAITAETGTIGWRVVIAIDTAIDRRRIDGDGRPYTAPRIRDVEVGAGFTLAARLDRVAELVSEAWVDDWLRQSHSAVARQHDGIGERQIAEPHDLGDLAPLACYLALLSTLAANDTLPSVRFPGAPGDDRTASILDVDLLIEIGTHSTSAHLIEANGRAAPDLGVDVVPLRIRDLADPSIEYTSPFPSAVEFTRFTFGNEALSRWSGRTDAFSCPSLVRIGHEAARLSDTPPIDELVTGLASPAPYLWDDNASSSVWRVASDSSGRRGTMVSGPLLAHLDESGTLSSEAERRITATKPRFSRAAMTTMLATELLVQAIVAINSADHHHERRQPHRARRIARMSIGFSTALGDHDRRQLLERTESAVALVWRGMGWASGNSTVGKPPTVSLAIDTATGLQVAHLWNEIADKFRGRGRDYFDLVGKLRPGHGASRCIRIASVDVGEGASGMAVATWELIDPAAIVSSFQLLDGFPQGIDSLLETVAKRFVLPAVVRHLGSCRLADAGDVLQRALGDQANPTGQTHQLSRRFARQVALPAARALMATVAEVSRPLADVALDVTLAELLGTGALNARPVLEELEAVVTDAGAESFVTGQVRITCLASEVVAAIDGHLQPMLAAVARVVKGLDCDLVLLGGRAALVPGMYRSLLAAMPVRPDRLVMSGRNRVGVPISDRGDTGAARTGCEMASYGAAIAARMPPMIGTHTLVIRPPDTNLMAPFIGLLDAQGRLPRDAVLVRPDAPGKGTSVRSGTRAQVTLESSLPAVVGSRRNPLEAWPAAPGWMLEAAPHKRARTLRMPLKLTFETERSKSGEELPVLRAARDADGSSVDIDDVVMLRRTRTVAEHWLDGGLTGLHQSAGNGDDDGG